MKTRIFILLLTILTGGPAAATDQDSTHSARPSPVSGFVRSGFYGDLHDNSPSPFISSAYADLGLKVDSRLTGSFRANADIRFRYGSEFHQAVSSVIVREAYIDYSFGKFSLSAGQKILKWGRADFTNPTSKLNPQNYISRSPEKEDMDMGNILSAITWSPSPVFSLQAVAVPYYRSSVLLVDPIPLPEGVTISQMDNLVAGSKLFSYGLRTDFHIAGIDWGATWFEGYDPMPGIAMSQFSADFSGPLPVITVGLKTTPYKIRMAGLDFETTAGRFGLRGEAAWTNPCLSYKTNEYVPMQEIKWVAGADITLGNWTFTGEYSGKYLPGFVPATADPIIGTEPDYAKLAALLATPGFDLQGYMKDEIGSFNRLYNYQMKEWYHQAGLRVEGDMAYGRLLPSLFTLYNFSTREIMLVPQIRFKPADALTLVAGAEIWSGKSGSLYHIVKNYMSAIYAGIKVDF
ncbi:MAG TPA: hypothetical protein VMT63_14915 [Bacteroidales bacterium]|nr:hypothetical protein [Bacteroidales bacterium]